MGQNILPPGTETFLSSKTGPQLESSMRSLYENVMLETAVADRLTQFGIDLGMARPPILFSSDDRWRAVVRVLAYSRKHTRNVVASFMELIIGPKVSQVTTLDRTNYAQIGKTNPLTIPGGPNAGVYLVSEILTHHLIFPAGTFVPESDVTYSIRGTASTYGNIIALADGRHALVDTTVMFVNTHPLDYLSKINTLIPQNGTLIFDKNSPPPATTEASYAYGFYDKYSSGFIKLDSSLAVPTTTRNRYTQIRSTVLNASVQTGALTIDLLDPANFPPSPAMVDQIQIGDWITILNVPVVGPLLITGITGNHELVIGGGGLPVPGAPASAEFSYTINAGVGTSELSGNRGHFFSKKGKIYSATKIVDVTKNFVSDVKPYTEGSSEPFSIIINRGEDSEEKIEVLSLAGNTIQLPLDPNDLLGATSLLKFNHSKGEPVEVFYEDKFSTGSYFPLTVAGATVGTAGAGSTDLVLIDLAATFVAENASPSYGDEVELVTVPAGSLNTVGERRTIITFTGATQVAVSPAFQDTMLGCTYRIRKLYKAAIDPIVPDPLNADGFLYLADTSMFPEANFSVIIDRGNSQEEVLWISANDLVLNQLTIGNSDHGTVVTAYPYFFKNHNFGAVVEPAQILVESCKWEVIETRATGEYTIAMDDGCIDSPKITDGWYLHEKTPHHLVDTSSDYTTAIPEVGRVIGGDVVGGVPTAFTYIPQAPLSVAVVAGDTSFQLSHINFVRLLANKSDSNNTKSGNLVFRPIYIDDGNAKEEKFVTKISDTSFGPLVANAQVGSTSIISSVEFSLPTQINIGHWNSKYPNQTEIVTATGVTLIVAPNPYAGNYVVTLAAPLSFSHVAGESLTTSPNVTLEVSEPFANGYPIAASAFVHYTYTHPSYRQQSSTVKVTDMSTNLPIAYPASGRWAYKGTPNQFSRGLVGDEIYVKGTPVSAVPLGERRKISAVGGTGNNLLVVNEGVEFSAAVADTSEFDVRPFLQTGDIANTAPDISGNANSAFPAALNLINLNTYVGGHKSTFPGKFIYQQLDIDSQLVDQPTQPSKLLTARYEDPKNLGSYPPYKFPGPRRLIVEPLLPYASELVSSGDASTLVANDAGGLVDVVGKYLEVLGPISSRDYRTIKKITNYSSAGPIGTFTCDSPFLDNMFMGAPSLIFRVLGDPTQLAISKGTVGPTLWVDYPDFFPDREQGDCVVTLSRGTSKATDVNITTCNSDITFGGDYGKFTANITEVVTEDFEAGDSIELKITQVALPTISHTTTGGFYLGFGFGPNRYTNETVGLGGDPNVVGAGLGNPIDKIVGGVHGPVGYKDETASPLRKGMYKVPKTTNSLKLAGRTAATLQSRCRVLSSAAVVGPPAVTRIQIADFNFLKQKYKWFIGAKVLSIGMSATGSFITAIDPATSTITVSPALGVLPGANDPIVLVANNVPIDDQERQSSIDNFFTVEGSANNIGTNGLFPQFQSTAGSTTTNIACVTFQPFSTSLIGSRLQGASGAPAGEVRTIVDVVSSAVAPSEIYDMLVVSAAFTGPTSTELFNILPAEDLFTPNKQQAVGGVYTGINYPESFASGISYPAHANLLYAGSVYERGASREGGIVQEYVEYSSESDNIYTLDTPFYPRYDHPQVQRL